MKLCFFYSHSESQYMYLYYMRKTFATISLIIICFTAKAATVDTVTIYSKAMQKSFKCVVIKPSIKKHKSTPLPVVYLLHGYSGWYSNWIIRVPELTRYADKYKLYIVCPDGGYSSWYFDSPMDSTLKYETYISKEVPEYIDANYNTIKNRTARAITGLSMGGHGALFISMRHSNTFGACGSMSGGVNLMSSKNKYDILKRIGDTINHASNWKSYSITGLIEQKPTDSIAITIDCGTGDPFYKDNLLLHEKMMTLNIPHDYTERPGKHNWDYWRNSVQYHLLFFNNYFEEMLKKE